MALPLSYWGAEQWLIQFAYRIELKWWLFILAAIIPVSIATLAILIQALRAVRLNPAISLRNE